MKNTQIKLWRKAKFAANILRIIPNIQAIAVTGSLAQGKANKKSDIDFLIVCQPKRIWTTRFFSTLLLQILGLRRIGKKIAGRICLNWYITSPNYDKYTKGWPIKIIWAKNSKSQTLNSKQITNHKSQILNFGDKVEQFLKNKQIKRIKKDPRTFAPGSRVKYEDDEIGFWAKKSHSP